jgi:hypothetical protein
MYVRNIEARLRIVVAVEKKQVFLTGLCVRACGYPGACAYEHVAFLFQHAKRMRHIVTSIVDPLSPPNFSTLYHKRRDFREKNIEHKMCILMFCKTFV